MKRYTEIYFSKSKIESDEWKTLCYEISNYLGFLHKWKLIVQLNDKIQYYIETNVELPVSFSKTTCFLLKSAQFHPLRAKKHTHTFGPISDTLLEWYHKNHLKRKKQLKQIEFHFLKCSDKLYSIGTFTFEKQKKLLKETRLILFPFHMLQIDFQLEKEFQYQNANFLDIKKSLSLLSNQEEEAILEIDPFPYNRNNCYLNLSHYDFDKHSLIVGASGTGKSKLMGLMISSFLNSKVLKQQYKIVVIDPHASLQEDIGGIEGVDVVDFEHPLTSILLFDGKKEDAFATTESYLSLFSTLLKGYNASLERVLRHSIYLLLDLELFTFQNLKKLLLNLEYRLELLKQETTISITNFFMGDFNELKNSSYHEAIAPIISFLDEMELMFQVTGKETLKEKVKENAVTIFSLNPMKLGTHTIQTIAGFLMQQILYMMMRKEIEEHLILMIDEVAVLENPILSKMLSEARKYGLSLVLAQQYFDQISDQLKSSIFANTQNYYIFRVSIKDAEELKGQIEMNIEEEKKVKILSTLKNQECVVRLGHHGTIYPAIKAKTKFLKSFPYQKRIQVEEEIEKKKISYSFRMDTQTSMLELLKSLSSSRKKVL